ncbi:hypothetical protein BBJ29_007287 [Phytophthora kernoviae]|uniref:FYVE-type domain-containing protein n=1 Tax=Phytophthora kernoviae TaxID=325452 RepID=A0A3F2RQL7_9STRA|nr:hypothetical protein BBJ29_007287 [Phytophthora kernoviae]RLN61494.1 hypothetical protein BBP00_00005370 [Phytophthora kernoviae]
MKKIFDKQFENGALVDSLSCTTPPPFAPIPDNKGRNGGWQLFSEDDGYNVFEQTYLSDKLQHVGRRAARHPQRQQLVQSSRLIGVHTLSSMNFKDIPELPKSSKTDRLHFRNAGVVIEETEGDAGGPLVRVSLFLSLMPSKLILKEVSQSPRMRAALSVGSEVTKKYRKWLQTLAVGVAHLVQTAKPSVTMQHLTKMMWAESDHCFLCHKNFRTYRRRHHCRFCGEAICASCSGTVDMTVFDVSYEGSGDVSDSVHNITIGHRKLDVHLASNSITQIARSENVSPNTSGGRTGEFIEARGCNTCVSELQMNLIIISHARGRQDHSLYSNSSSDSLPLLANTQATGRSITHETHEDTSYDNFHGPPPSYPGRNSDFEHDQVMPMRPGDYQQYQQYAGPKMSLSTISSSSYSGLSPDERAQLALYSSTSSAEFMGKVPLPSTSVSSSNTPSSVSASDASLSAFLARDPDILSLDGLMLSPGGSSVAPSLKTVMDDDEHMDLMYKRGSNWEPSMGNRSSYATTTNTNEGSNHSQFRFANMTAQEKQIAERLIRETNAQGNSRADGRPPLITRHQSQYQPDYEMSPVHLASKKAHHMTRAATSPSPSPSLHSMNSSHSSGSAHSDLIQLIIPAKDPEEADFIVFDNSRQTEGFSRSDASNDMIPLSF